MVSLSIPLRCFPKAVLVVAACGGAGAALGTALAMITRTRRPAAIYFWLAVCALTILPLILAWPPADSYDVVLWKGAPDILNNYFDLLRGGVFLLAFPFPFARLGQHGPDEHNADKSGSQE
jgi:hypothetical protein